MKSPSNTCSNEMLETLGIRTDLFAELVDPGTGRQSPNSFMLAYKRFFERGI